MQFYLKINLFIALSLLFAVTSFAQTPDAGKSSFMPAIQTGSQQAADVICISKNGKTLLSSSSVGHETFVWDLNSRKLLKKIKSNCKFLSVSENGSVAVLASTASIKWYNLYTGQQLGEIIARGVITDLAINSRGTLAAIGIYNQGIHVIDLKKGLIIKKLTDSAEDAGTINGLYFLRNDSILAHSFFMGKINMYNTWNWSVDKRCDVTALIKNASFTDDARWGLYNEGTDSVFLFDNNTCAIIKSYGVQISFFMMPLDISADGHWGLTGSDDGYVTLIDLYDNIPPMVVKAHQSKVTAVRFNPDGNYFISAGDDGSIKQFTIEGDNEATEISLVNADISDVVYAGNGNNVLFLAGNALNQLDVATGRLNTIAQVSAKQAMRRDSTSNIWNTINKDMMGIDPYSQRIVKASASPYCMVSFDGYSTLFDVATKKVKLDKLPGVAPFCITPTGSHAMFFSPNGLKVLGYDLTKNKALGSFARTEYMNVMCISADGKKGFTSYKNNSIAIWDLATGKLIKNFKSTENGIILSMIINHNNDRLYLSRLGGVIEIWDIKNYKLLKSLDQQSLMFLSLESSKDVKITGGFKQLAFSIGFSSSHMSFDDSTGLLMYAFNMGVVFLYDTKNDKIKTIDLEAKSQIKRVEIKPGGQYAYIAYDNNAVDYLNLNNEKVLCTFIPANQSDFIEITPDNYYFATKDISKFIGFTKDLDYYTFEQLDVKYNRPDKVLESIGGADTSLISSYRAAYYKRIKKLGVDTTAFINDFAVPEADFANRGNIPHEQTQRELKLHISGTDNTTVLDRFNVWVNESPLFGIRGINIKDRHTHSIDTTITIQLSHGENVVETSVTNINAAESYRKPLRQTYTAASKANEKVYFIGIGINHFKDNTNPLSWSVKDIRDEAKALKAKFGDQCIIIDTLFDERVTTRNVVALKQQLMHTTVDDKVIIAYSGHGLFSKDYDYFLSTYDVNFKNPMQGGIPYEELENLLDGIPARKKLLLLDACHSGEVDKDELTRYATAQGSLSKNGVTRGGDVVDYDSTNKRLGMKNSFELMQQLFVNVGRNTGAIVISAAGGTQFAYEHGELSNGVFTHCVLEAMKADHMTVSKLQQQVSVKVAEITSGLQVPTARTEIKSVDWEVW